MGLPEKMAFTVFLPQGQMAVQIFSILIMKQWKAYHFAHKLTVPMIQMYVQVGFPITAAAHH